MDNQQRLEQIARHYRDQGYQVTLHPGPKDLPPFAKDFQVEILASRPDGNVLASVKGSALEIENDSNLSRYAEVIEGQPGWRYDLYALGPPPSTPKLRDATEASEEEIARALEDATHLEESGYRTQAVVAAWAATESAMRYRLRSMGSKAGYGTSLIEMLNELISQGIISHGDFRHLEGLWRLRSIIVHGFSVPEVGADVVPFLAGMARRLMEEANAARQAS